VLSENTADVVDLGHFGKFEKKSTKNCSKILLTKKSRR